MAPPTNCEVCTEAYDEIKRPPKFLHCFHTYCVYCLEKIAVDGVISCPTCRRETPIDSETGAGALQTNFYCIASSNDDAKPSEESAEEKKEAEQLHWCTLCQKIAVKECHTKHHDVHDLKSEDGREMASTYLKMQLITCRTRLNTTLNTRREVESTINSVDSALEALEQQVDTIKKENQQKIKRYQKTLDVITRSLNESQQFTGKEMGQMLQKYSDLADVSMGFLEEAATFSSAFDSVQGAAVTMDIKTSNQGKLPIPLFNQAKLNFLSSGTDEREAQLMTAFSYLVLCATKGDKLPVASNPPAAKAAKKLKSKQAPEQAGATAQAAESKPKQSANPAPTPKAKSQKQGPGKNPGPTPMNQQQHGAGPSKPPHFNKGAGGQPFRGNRPLTPAKTFPMQNSVGFPNQQFVHNLRMNGPVQMPLLNSVHLANVPPPNLRIKKCSMTIAVNGKSYGNIVIELRSDVAPKMCHTFVEHCIGKSHYSYQGSTIYKVKPKGCIMGGKIKGFEEVYTADESPLKKSRSAIFLRLKRDYSQSKCSIVSSEFCICLSDDKADEGYRTSSVFGYVSDGLAVCDAVSHMDCTKDHIALTNITVS